MALATLLAAARATRSPCDVLYVGRTDLAELRDVEAARLRVTRTTSVVEAIDRLGSGGVALAVVHVEALGDREEERFAALRRAGAAAVVGVYPPALAWRADRAAASGADAALALPAPPGALADLCRRFVRVAAEAPLPAPQAEAPPPEPSPALPDAPGTAPAPVLAPAPPPAVAVPATPPVPRSPWIELVVADVATMNRSLPDLDRVLDQALAAFQRRAGAERCSILLYDRSRTALRVRRTTVPQSSESGAAPAPTVEVDDTGLAARVAKSGRTALIADVGAAPPEFAGIAFPGAERGYVTRSCVVVPLRGAEDVIGVVCLTERTGGAPFRDLDVPPLEFLAAQAGQAIENGLEMQRLQELAAVDELTGLANRRQFQIAVEREVQRARRYDRPMSLAILDLDHFKTYNDTSGHQAGDRALAKVGELLRTTLREVDVVARYGGEEFAVILPETSARPSANARNPYPFLERLRVRIEETEFPGEERLPGGRLTISGGVACFPDDATTVDELIREADRALYVSKSRGRNTISYRGHALSE